MSTASVSPVVGRRQPRNLGPRLRRVAAVAPAIVLITADLVIATNFALHRSAFWDHDGDVIVKVGSNLSLSCSLSGLGFFDVLRITHTQDTTSHVLCDNLNVKSPYSQMPRYIVHHDYNGDMATVSILYNGIHGEDSGVLGCRKLGEEDYVSYVTVKVLVPVQDVYIVSVSPDGAEKRFSEANDSEIYLEERKLSGLGCNVTIEGSPVLPDVRMTVAGEDRTSLFEATNHTQWLMLNSKLKSVHNVVQLKMMTQHPQPEFNGKILKCTATVSGFEPVTASAQLFVRYSPRITCNHNTIETRKGGNATFVCLVQSNPGSQLKWMHDGQRKHHIVSGKDGYVISNKLVGRDSNEAKMSIVNVREHHFTRYVLKATNDFETSHQLQLLQRAVENDHHQQHQKGKTHASQSNLQQRKPVWKARNTACILRYVAHTKLSLLFWTSLSTLLL